MSDELPDPPRDEFDESGRPVHPYVRSDAIDPSVDVFEAPDEEKATISRYSRLAFHEAEGLFVALTPWAMLELVGSLISRLRPSDTLDGADADLVAEVDEAIASGRNARLAALQHFEAMHADRLAEIARLIEEMRVVCPGCGKIHDGDDHDDAVQPGGYVHAETGDAVRVKRVEARHVYATKQVAEDREIDRVYERPWFDENFVRGDRVEIIGEGS